MSVPTAGRYEIFDKLGSREKKHYVFEGGHVPPRQHEMIRVVLEWFDKYLGPV